MPTGQVNNRLKLEIDMNNNFGYARPLMTLILCATSLSSIAQMNQPVSTHVLSQPLSRVDAVDIALRQNSAILQAKADLKANYGVSIQTRSIVLPKVTASGNYNAQDAGSVEQIPIPMNAIQLPNQNWQSQIRVQQSIYEGGRVTSALRAVKLTREAAELNYETVVADTLLNVRVAYDDVLLGAQQIEVQEASVKLLTQELGDTRRRFDAGTLPRFNVLRAEVERANAQPRLIRARNAYRVAKNNLSNLLGWNLPKTVWEDIPLRLSDVLAADPCEISLPVAIGRAMQNRTELSALNKARSLRREDIVNARAGYKPSAQIFAGYGWRSPGFENDLARDLNGWQAGAQVSWNLFDGAFTRGKVMEAEARYEKARLDLDDAGRRIELEVRTSYSDFIQSKEVLESQKKVQEQAEEALRLAEVRMDAGTGTQLDVLGAQTSLTEARTTQVQALRDYSVARARLERAMGETLHIERISNTEIH